MKVSILIPSLLNNVEKQMNEIIAKTDFAYYDIITTCKKQSASKNRNECLNRASTDLVIMIDDDITGFYKNWIDDLIRPLIENENKYNIVSARLINKEFKIIPMLGDNNNQNVLYAFQKAIHTNETGLNVVCSACIAFYKSDEVYFDEDYKSAVCEDTQFCIDYNKKFPNREIIINNTCQLIHNNEMKRLNRADVKDNFELFYRKNGIKLI